VTDETLSDPIAEETPFEKPKRTYRRKNAEEPTGDVPDVLAEVMERDPLHEPEIDGLAGTWRPDGGPEMNRWSGELTPEILARFRAHCVTGGHQKRPDQSRTDDDGWYIHPSRADGDARLARDVAKLRPLVRDPKLFDKLMIDDGRCGGAKWVVSGQRVTSTSIWSAFYACRILELTEGRDIQSVVDLGGGYGHLAHILADHFPSVRLVELPICLALAREWTDKVTLSHPYEEWTGDLVINTMSMQHMTADNLDWYDGQFRARPPRCMYLVNRTTKRDPTDVPFADYPFLSMFNTVSERMLTGKHIEWFGER
jgi:hypothetical protein